MKVYIAGPMRGYPRWNFAAFDAAVARWQAEGHVAISPADIDRLCGFDPDGPDEQVSSDFLRQAIMRDIVMLTECDAVALLPGWETSSGVAVELAVAHFLRLGVYDAVTFERLTVERSYSTALQVSCPSGCGPEGVQMDVRGVFVCRSCGGTFV